MVHGVLFDRNGSWRMVGPQVMSRGVKQTYDQFVRTVTLDGQRAFGAREDLQIEYDKGFDLYSKAGATRPEMRPYVASFALQLGYDDARDQDRW